MPINLRRRNGINTRLAQASLIVATKNGSTPDRILPINPKENAQIRDTIARYITYKKKVKSPKQG